MENTTEGDPHASFYAHEANEKTAETSNFLRGLNSAGVAPDNNVLHVDRSCLNCSGNNAGAVIHQLKMACLSYTQSPVTYQEKRYAITEMFRVRGQVLSMCQKLIRQNIYKSKEHDGISIRN